MKIGSLVLFNFLQNRSKAYLLGTRAYLLANRSPQQFCFGRHWSTREGASYCPPLLVKCVHKTTKELGTQFSQTGRRYYFQVLSDTLQHSIPGITSAWSRLQLLDRVKILQRSPPPDWHTLCCYRHVWLKRLRRYWWLRTTTNVDSCSRSLLLA